MKRPSLTRIILSLQTALKQQEALAHVLTALQIAYARDAIVNSLGGVASTVLERAGGEEPCEYASIVASTPDASSAHSFTLPTSAEVPRSRVGSLVPSAGLDDFTSLLTVEDARVLVDLLKLAVANRVGERGRETLGTVLTAMGKANPEVGMLWGLTKLGGKVCCHVNLWPSMKNFFHKDIPPNPGP